MISSHDGWGCCRVTEFHQNGPLAPCLKARFWTDSYDCWSESTFGRPFPRLKNEIQMYPILFRASTFLQCPAGLEVPKSDFFEMPSKVNDSQTEQCDANDFVDEAL